MFFFHYYKLSLFSNSLLTPLSLVNGLCDCVFSLWVSWILNMIPIRTTNLLRV